MRLRRRSAEPTRRQRLASPDLSPKPSPFAYRGRRSDESLNTGRQLQRDLGASTKKAARFWAQRFGLLALLIAGFISAYNVLSLSSQPKVLTLPVSGNQTNTFLQPETTYQQAASQLLSDSIWNKNKLTLNTAELRRQMLARFPELDDVSITLPLLAHRPLIYLQPAQPALVLTGGNGSFIVSTSGKALIRATGDLGAYSQLPVVTDQSHLAVRLGRQALPADNADFIRIVTAQLAAKQYNVAGMTLPAGTNELDVQLAGQPYQVKFNLHGGKAREQAGTFLATAAYLKKQNVMPSQYVDVRVIGRAYYQ